MIQVRPTRLEVDLEAIASNISQLRSRAGGVPMCAVVKANGYGHGAVEVARAAVDAGVAMLAVALVEEAEELRTAGIDVPILLLSEPGPEHAARIVAASVTASVYTSEMLDALASHAPPAGPPLPIHLVFDSGMARVGTGPDGWKSLLVAAREAADRGELDVEGIWTHLARADEDVTTNDQQLQRFDRALAEARASGIDPRLVHAANSAATLRYPAAHFNMVRCGIAIYGLSPAPDVRAVDHGLRQALRLVTEVSFVKRVGAGTPVSYGHSWSAPSDGWVATLPVGYADGVPRALTNKVSVIVDGVERPMVGNVTMDQVMVWCDDHEPAVGAEVVLLGAGTAGGFIGVDAWASAIPTISYEVSCAISQRVPRHYTSGDAVDADDERGSGR